MASENGAVSVDQLLQKISAIETRLRDLEAANRQGKWITRLVLLLIAVVAIGSMWRTLQTITSFPPAEYQRAAIAQMEYLMPYISKQATTLVRNVAPVYEEAFRKEFEAHLPGLAALAKDEMDQFIFNVSSILQERINDGIRNVVSDNLAELVKGDPKAKLTDAELDAILLKIQDVFYTEAQHSVQKALQGQINAIADLQVAIESLPTPPHIADMPDSQLTQHTQDVFLELIATRLNLLEELTLPEDANPNPEKGR